MPVVAFTVRGPLAAGVAVAVLLLAGPARAATTTYVGEGHALRYLRGTAAPPAGWTSPGFDDAALTVSASGVDPCLSVW